MTKGVINHKHISTFYLQCLQLSKCFSIRDCIWPCAYSQYPTMNKNKMPFIECPLYVWSQVILTFATSLSGRSDFPHFQKGILGLRIVKGGAQVWAPSNNGAGISTQVFWFVVQSSLTFTRKQDTTGHGCGVWNWTTHFLHQDVISERTGVTAASFPILLLSTQNSAWSGLGSRKGCTREARKGTTADKCSRSPTASNMSTKLFPSFCA